MQGNTAWVQNTQPLEEHLSTRNNDQSNSTFDQKYPTHLRGGRSNLGTMILVPVKMVQDWG